MKLINNNDIHDASVNLALEEYCVRNLDFREESYVLFYINSPSVIIGKHQNTVEEVNEEYVKKNNIQIVRRISGGGAVYHDLGNLNFSFLTKHADNSVNNFRKFTQPIVDILRKLGIKAELSGRNDIVVEDRKISGNAQFTNLKTMFSHGTLLFDSNLDDVVRALNVRTDKIESKGIKSIRSRVANITEFLKEIHKNQKFSIYDFKNEIISELFKDYSEIPVVEISDTQWKEIYKLSEEKYKIWDWNYGRSPEFNIRKIKRFEFGQIDARINVKDGKVKNIKFFGDYLGFSDNEDIERILTDIKYEENNFINALKHVDMNAYFGNISVDEFVKFLLI